MTETTDKSDTGEKRTPKTSSSHPDPRLVALARMLARRAAEQDFAELVRRQGGTRQGPSKKERPT